LDLEELLNRKVAEVANFERREAIERQKAIDTRDTYSREQPAKLLEQNFSEQDEHQIIEPSVKFDPVIDIAESVITRDNIDSKNVKDTLDWIANRYSLIEKALTTSQTTSDEKTILDNERLRLAGILYFDFLGGPKSYGDNPRENIGVYAKTDIFPFIKPITKKFVSDLKLDYNLSQKTYGVLERVYALVDIVIMQEREKIADEFQSIKQKSDAIKSEWGAYKTKYGDCYTSKGNKFSRKELREIESLRKDINQRYTEHETAINNFARINQAHRLIDAVKERLFYRKL
jgi:hypothetical protein